MILPSLTLLVDSVWILWVMNVQVLLIYSTPSCARHCRGPYRYWDIDESSVDWRRFHLVLPRSSNVFKVISHGLAAWSACLAHDHVCGVLHVIYKTLAYTTESPKCLPSYCDPNYVSVLGQSPARCMSLMPREWVSSVIPLGRIILFWFKGPGSDSNILEKGGALFQRFPCWGL